MKRIIALGLILVLAAMCLVSCGGDSIVGKWKAEQDGMEVTFTFTEDTVSMGTMGMNMDPVEYTEEDGKLTFEMMGEKMEFEYSVDGDELTLTNEGEDQVFTRVEE